MIGLIDYNMGNLRSVTNAFEKLGVAIEIVKDAETVSKFDKIILPGVGAFKDAMMCLKERNLDEAVRSFAASGKPLLGICLGMQLLFESSVEFGECEGLGLIEGEIVKFDTSRFDQRLKVPHMGWNQLHVKKRRLCLKGCQSHFTSILCTVFMRVVMINTPLVQQPMGMIFPVPFKKRMCLVFSLILRNHMPMDWQF